MRLLVLATLLASLGLGARPPASGDAAPAVSSAHVLTRPPQPHLSLGMSGSRETLVQLRGEGVPFDTFAAFIGWWPGKSPTWFLEEAQALEATPFISWEPDKVPLSAIAGGAWDAYLVLWAKEIQRYGYPVYLRLAHEMNGVWYTWSSEGPAVFREAWRHVWQVFKSVGVTNARFVWSPDGLIGKPIGEWEAGLTPWYPGRRFVDYIGMSTVEFQSSVKWGLSSYFERLDFLRRRFRKPMVLPEMKVVESDRHRWLEGLRGYLIGRPWFKLLVWSETPSSAQRIGQFETGNMNWSLLEDPLSRRLLTRAVGGG